jgi:hypothetical protein
MASRGPRVFAAALSVFAALKMAGCGMFGSMPTPVTAMSAMTPAMTATGIHWRRNCQKSCHHERSKRRTKHLLHLTASFLLISLQEAVLAPSRYEVLLRNQQEVYDLKWFAGVSIWR